MSSDADTESQSSDHDIEQDSSTVESTVKSTVKSRAKSFIEIPYLDTVKYANSEHWIDFLTDQNTLDAIPYDLTWVVMFAQLRKKNQYFQITNKLRDEVKQNKHIKIYPKPRYLFSAFLACPANKLKVVILGQDPYPKSEFDQLNGIQVPQAMGMSFSVAHGINITSSLRNIYQNLIEFKHIDKMPDSGNLWFWAVQGCLMLNTALTVRDDEKQSHSAMWKWFTDEIIKYISDNFDSIIFVLWGRDAYNKINLIDQDKHHTIISSHPSGLSVNKPMQNFPAFAKHDHFGEINRILKEDGRTPILWK